MPPAKGPDCWNGTRKDGLITTFSATSRESLRRIAVCLDSPETKSMAQTNRDSQSSASARDGGAGKSRTGREEVVSPPVSALLPSIRDHGPYPRDDTSTLSGNRFAVVIGLGKGPSLDCRDFVRH